MNQSLTELESLGRYKLQQELGRGGMAVVYLAHDTELDRDVAVKCVQGTGSMADRLRSEAKLLAQLNHPNVVQLYDVVEQDDILGLVIEFVGGNTLTQRVKLAPTKEIKLKWLAEIAEGLASAHKKGIAHCDLKADNVLVTHDNIAKIADFGIAKVKLDDYLEDDGLTRVETVSGSYFSLSPEQATGQPVDTRTDLFSFAVLCYQTLIGHHPFGDTSNKLALLQRIINDPLDVNGDVSQALGPRLVDLISNLLSKDPQDRIYNAQEAAELIRNELQNSSSVDENDYTVAIETQPRPLSPIAKNSPRSNWKGISSKALLIGAGFLVGIILIQLLPAPEIKAEEISYIALDNIEVAADKDFSTELLPLIKTTLQQNVENTILSFQQTGLVEAKELNSIDGSYLKKAQATGVKDILVVSASCIQRMCDIKLQRRSGDRMAIKNQTTFPVASDSLVDLSNALSAEIPKLFDRSVSQPRPSSTALNESIYRRYMELYTASNSGSSNDPSHFHEAQGFILNNPNFIPAYNLLYRLASYWNGNTGNDEYLLKALDVCEKAPDSIKNDKLVKHITIKALLDLKRIPEAKSIYSVLEQSTTDRLFISKVESAIAYAEDDYSKLLELDRQNAIWRPSANNLYNLATSEFFFGNNELARSNVEQVLLLTPNDTYALDLKATIEMNLGNLELAIQTYQALLERGADSNAYSNYGLALSVSGNYAEAVNSLEKAVLINSKSSLYLLNLADAQTLSKNTDQAKSNYRKVATMLKNPKTAQEFSTLSQAQAHLGDYNSAVKTLKVARKKYPNIAEIDYAASIVNTLAGNYISAVVDANDAIERGTAPIWFSFEWFKPLCGFKDFRNTTGAMTESLCSE